MQHSENTAERHDLDTGESPEPTASQLEQVAALLSGKDVDEETSEPEKAETEKLAEGESPKPTGKLATLDAIAERLGVDVSELYNVQVPFGGGESPKTLGEIKDLVTDVDSFEVERLAWQEEKAKREADFMRSAQELTDLVSMLPKSAVTKELVQKVAERRAEAQEREDKLLRRVLPEWADEQVEMRDRKVMREHLAEYGFPANYLDAMVDHRTVKFIRDAALRKQRIDKALERVRTVKKPGHKPSARPAPGQTTGRQVGKQRAAKSQISQIVDLINNG